MEIRWNLFAFTTKKTPRNFTRRVFAVETLSRWKFLTRKFNYAPETNIRKSLEASPPLDKIALPEALLENTVTSLPHLSAISKSPGISQFYRLNETFVNVKKTDVKNSCPTQRYSNFMRIFIKHN